MIYNEWVLVFFKWNDSKCSSEVAAAAAAVGGGSETFGVHTFFRRCLSQLNFWSTVPMYTTLLYNFSRPYQ